MKILLVDDDISLNNANKRLFECFGHEVVLADCGKNALGVIEKENKSDRHIDIVISDHQMNGMNGDDLARNIKAINCTLPVVIWSTCPERIKNISYADKKINKFISSKELMEIIEELVKNKYETKQKGGGKFASTTR